MSAITYLTIKEVAVRLSLSPRSVRRLISSGKLPAYRVGSASVRIREADLDKVVKRIPSADLEYADGAGR